MYCKIVKSHLRFATNLKSQNLIEYIYNNYNVDCDTIKKFEQILTNSIDLAAMKILSHLTHLLLLANYCDAFYVANSQQQMRAVPSTLIRSTRRSDDGVGHSFVEGGQYESQRAEIEAMGGDPFFMDNAEEEENEITKHKQDEEQDNFAATTLAQASEFSSLLALANEREKAASSTNGKGPASKKIDNVQEHKSDWVWDGIVDEDAHMGLD